MIASLLLVHDAFLEGLLRAAEREFAATLDPTAEAMWSAYADEDAALLGAWRALWPVLV